MAVHRAGPEAAGVEVRIVRPGADGGGVEQDFRAHQHHRAGGFGIPLVPADADAGRAVAGLPYLEAGIAGAGNEFLQIARPVGDLALARSESSRGGSGCVRSGESRWVRDNETKNT